MCNDGHGSTGGGDNSRSQETSKNERIEMYIWSVRKRCLKDVFERFALSVFVSSYLVQSFSQVLRCVHRDGNNVFYPWNLGNV